MNKKEKKEILEEIRQQLEKSVYQWGNCFSQASQLKCEGCIDGYFLIADRRLQQGDIYRVKEALLNAEVDEGTDTHNDYILRCAQRALELLRESKVVYIESQSQNEMFQKMDDMTSAGKEELGSSAKKIIEVLEAFGIEVTQEDYELLATAAMRQFIAELNSSCMAVKSDADFRQERFDEVNRLRALAGFPSANLGSIMDSKSRAEEETAIRAAIRNL